MVSSDRIEVHVPIRLAIEKTDIAEVRAGAFATRAEAQLVLEYWRSIGHTRPMAIRSLPGYATADEWIAAGAVAANGEPVPEPVG